MKYREIRTELVKFEKLLDSNIYNGLVRMELPKGAKPNCCPYCGGFNVSSHAGKWECRDCGNEGSY